MRIRDKLIANGEIPAEPPEDREKMKPNASYAKYASLEFADGSTKKLALFDGMDFDIGRFRDFSEMVLDTARAHANNFMDTSNGPIDVRKGPEDSLSLEFLNTEGEVVGTSNLVLLLNTDSPYIELPNGDYLIDMFEYDWKRFGELEQKAKEYDADREAGLIEDEPEDEEPEEDLSDVYDAFEALEHLGEDFRITGARKNGGGVTL